MAGGTRIQRTLAIAAAAGVLALTAACAQPIQSECDNDGGVIVIVVTADGGTNNNNGGTDAGARTDAGLNADAGSTADAGLEPTDGGTEKPASRADAGAFAWALMPGTATSETIHAVHGTSGSNMFHASSQGIIRHSSGGAWTDVFTMPFGPPPVTAVWVTPDGKVFAGADYALVRCTTPPCTAQAQYTVTNLNADISPLYGHVNDVCGLGADTVYAVGDYSSQARLWKFDFANDRWVVQNATLGVGGGESCLVDESGEVFVTGDDGRLVRVTRSGIPYTENSVAQQDFTPTSFYPYALHKAGSRLFAVGNGFRILERDATTNPATWKLVWQPATSTTYRFYAIGGGAPDEAYAGGEPGSNRRLSRFNGTSWTFPLDTDPATLSQFMIVHDLWAPDPDTLLVAGTRYGDGAVVLGTRP